MSEKQNEKLLEGFFRSLSFIFGSVIYGLDISILYYTWSSMSIGYHDMNQTNYFGAQGISVLILGGVFLVITFTCVCTSAKEELSEDAAFLIPFTFLILLIDLPRELILSKYISCFNFTSHSKITARVVIKFIFLSSTIILNVISLVKDFSRLKIVRTINLIVFVILCLGIAFLNLKLLLDLKPKLKAPIGPDTIQMALLNAQEINQLENEEFRKDNLFEYRVLGNLSEILFNKKKEFAYEDCSKCYRSNEKDCQCIRYYWHYMTVNINCTEDTARFYKDCLNAKSLRIGLQYLDEQKYPLYNCAVLDEYTCQLGCPNLLPEYRLYLVQNNPVTSELEVAWKGLCNCVQKYYGFALGLKPNMDVCYSKHHSNANLVKSNYNSFLFLSILIAFYFIKF